MLLPGESAWEAVWEVANAKKLSSSKSQRKLSGTDGEVKLHMPEGENPTVLENKSLESAWRIF